MKIISGLQVVVLAAPVVVVVVLLSYKFGVYNSKQHYINHGAEQHWLGKIECGRVGNEIFCAETGDEQ